MWDWDWDWEGEEWVSERMNIEMMIKMEITGPRVVTEGGHVR